MKFLFNFIKASFTLETEKMRFLLRLCARHYLLYLGISIIVHTTFLIEWEYRWELYCIM